MRPLCPQRPAEWQELSVLVADPGRTEPETRASQTQDCGSRFGDLLRSLTRTAHRASLALDGGGRLQTERRNTQRASMGPGSIGCLERVSHQLLG